jgi:hypothetical protein
MTVSKSEPSVINPSVTVQWEKTFASYSYDDGFTSAYYTISGSLGNATITGSYALGKWTFILTAALNILSKGTYRLVGFVEKGTGPSLERYQVFNAPIKVTESLATAVTTDTREQYQKELELINTAIANYVTDPVEEATAAGKSYRRPTILMLQKMRSQLIALIAKESRKINIANGRKPGGTVFANLSAS